MRGRITKSRVDRLLTRAAQGSNLPLPDLESGVPPLELPAHYSEVRREGLEPPQAYGQRLYRPPQLPLCHLRI